MSAQATFDIQVVEERWNPLAERKELQLVITHVAQPTPTRCQVRDAIAERYKVDKKYVVVRKLVTEYGIGRSKATVHIYKDLERMKKLEPEKVLKHNEKCEG